MTVAEREALVTEARRHELVVAVLCDEEAAASLQTALAEEAKGMEVSFAELRSKYGKHR